MTTPLRFTLNGREVDTQAQPQTLLVDLLRNTLQLTGTHVGCDTSQCGCCTVLLDGQAVKSCTMLALQAQGRAVTTVEGLAPAGGPLHPVQQAFVDCHGLQCGFCTPGMVMSATGLLRHNPAPSEAEIEQALEGNLCRCTGYVNIVKAVQKAAEAVRQGAKA
ncbi:MAG: (2Fe-2S)-binding protein [Pseudomonadota bacterium]